MYNKSFVYHNGQIKTNRAVQRLSEVTPIPLLLSAPSSALREIKSLERLNITAKPKHHTYTLY